MSILEVLMASSPFPKDVRAMCQWERPLNRARLRERAGTNANSLQSI